MPQKIGQVEQTGVTRRVSAKDQDDLQVLQV
jgi:hypothetical protein